MNTSDPFETLLQQDAARNLLVDLLIGERTPGEIWRENDPDCTTIERMLRTEALMVHTLFELIREDVTEARHEGRSWEEIGVALGQEPSLVALTYGDEPL